MTNRIAVLLGDALRPRVQRRGELPVDDRPPPAGAGDREPRHHPQRPLPRGDRSTRTARRPASLFIDKTTGKEARVKGKAVILAAGACETVRILLNSRGTAARRSPTPAARSASTSWTRSARSCSGQIPALENLPPHNEDGAGGDHVYAPWWLYKEQQAGKLDFARGYHIETGGSRPMPGGGNPVPDDLTRGSYGTKFKEDARRYYGSFVDFAARGEMIPNEDCYMDLDPTVKDKWGIPVARFHWKWSEPRAEPGRARQEDVRGADRGDGRHACATRTTSRPTSSIQNPGYIIHEVGGALPRRRPEEVRLQRLSTRRGT